MARKGDNEENITFYSASFKAYDISRCQAGGADTWYEWVERRMYLMRVKISSKILKWLVNVFIKASKVQGNVIKKWRLAEAIDGQRKIRDQHRYRSRMIASK